MRVKVQEVVGRRMSSRTDGKKMRKYLQQRWEKEDNFVIDFENIEVASVSFIDEAFGALLEHYSLDDMKAKLKFENMDEHDRKLLNYLILSRDRENRRLHSDTEG